MLRRLILLVAVSAAPAAVAAAPRHRLTEHDIRDFVARQERLWVRRDFDGYFALAAPEAVFVTERRAADGAVTSEQESVAESRRAAERAFASLDGFSEKSFVDRVRIAPDGRSAIVLGHEEAELVRGAVRKHLCAATEQKLVLRKSRILSLGQTDRPRPCHAAEGR